MNMMKPPYLVFDIGGTKSRFAISFDGINLSGITVVQTPQTYAEGIRAFQAISQRIAAGQILGGVAGGLPGAMDVTKSTLVGAPHLPDWIGKPIRSDIAKIFVAPVYLENDTALVGLGETVMGAGVAQPIVAYMTVSTGVNGVRIVNGRIDVSTHGFEIGHQVIDQGMELESFIGGAAVALKYGKNPGEITDVAVWDLVAKYTAYAVNNTILYWSPSIVVLGGAMITKIPIPAVRNHLQKIFKIYPDIPPVVAATLGDMGGLYGALQFVSSVEY